jgi:hypothetical protein
MKQLYGYNDEVSHEWTDGVWQSSLEILQKLMIPTENG